MERKICKIASKKLIFLLIQKYISIIMSQCCQVHSGVRGYVWRDKFYGTVMTPDDTLHIEPLAHVRPVNSR